MPDDTAPASAELPPVLSPMARLERLEEKVLGGVHERAIPEKKDQKKPEDGGAKPDLGARKG